MFYPGGGYPGFYFWLFGNLERTVEVIYGVSADTQVVQGVAADVDVIQGVSQDVPTINGVA